MKELKAKYIGVSKLGLIDGKTYNIRVAKNSNIVSVLGVGIRLEYSSIYDFFYEWTNIKNA